MFSANVILKILNCFKSHPEATELLVTSDRQLFLQMAHASNHANSQQDRRIETVKRGQLTQADHEAAIEKEAEPKPSVAKDHPEVKALMQQGVKAIKGKLDEYGIVYPPSAKIGELAEILMEHEAQLHVERTNKTADGDGGKEKPNEGDNPPPPPPADPAPPKKAATKNADGAKKAAAKKTAGK